MNQERLQELVRTPGLALYEVLSPEPSTRVIRLVASSEATRAICNNPMVAGTLYTDRLRSTCTEVFRNYDFGLEEQETVVLTILRGALNFGLREALSAAYGWHRHNTSFISAQRARDEQNPDSWHITEKSYRKIYFGRNTSIVMGDVVATGTSLRYGLQQVIEAARSQGTSLRNFVFFTYGGDMAEKILEEVDTTCRSIFPEYRKTFVVYLEGRFTVPDHDTPLSIKLTGTDLVRYDALMAPEFIESQYESPSYPLERCIIYDAGSRAFWIPEYAEDVLCYWKQVLGLAETGTNFRQLLAERFPGLDPGRFPAVDLGDLCRSQISKIQEEFFPDITL